MTVTPLLAAVLAALLAAGAAGLAVPGRPRPVTAVAVRPTWRVPPTRGAVVGLAGLAGTLPFLVDGLRLVLALIVVGSAAATALLVRQARRAAAAERRRSKVVEVCEALAGELRAGQPAAASLEHVVQVWPELAPVSVAARLGADVPASMRRLGSLPGAEGMGDIASAWQVSQSSGSGLAAALSQVAETARERQSTRHLVRGELASAQATARLVALLPVASLAMSSGIGGHPWHFLLGTPVGLACLGSGALCAFSGLWWIDRIAAAVLGR
jgi:tight adherence protein B